MQRLQRILAIHRLLEGGGSCTATALARDFRVHVRTIYRDVDYLREELRAPVLAQGNRGYQYGERGYRLPELALPTGELLAFLVAERVLAGYAQAAPPFVAPLQEGLRRLSESLGDPVAVSLADLSERGHPFDPEPLRSLGQELTRLFPPTASAPEGGPRSGRAGSSRPRPPAS